MISQKGLYGLLSGIFTTSVLQPFQTVKMTIMLPPSDFQLTNNFAKNIYNAIRYIIKVNGYAGLYKDLVAAASKAGMGCYIYFTILRKLEKPNQTQLQDFAVSSVSRIASTFFTNTLSIIQTRWQITNFHKYKTIFGAVSDIYRTEGIQGFFSGALTSCLKEGFFAGLYYMFYQQLKDQGLGKFQSGIIGGMISTLITHPFELIRAKIQTIGISENKKYSINDHHLIREIKQLIRSGDWFKGVAPRLIKKPFANTVTFCIFQLIQQHKNNIKQQN